MSYETVSFIRNHKDLYRLLREDSSYYEKIYQDNSYVYTLNKIAKQKYGTRFVDRVERIGEKINILSSFLDVFQ